MIEATAYNKASGVIIASYVLETIEDIELQLDGSSSYVEGHFDGDLYWIKDGVPTERIDADLGIPAVVQVGDSLTFTVPDDSIAYIGADAFTGDVSVDTSFPRYDTIFLSGGHRGTFRFNVKGYVENRVEAYPALGEQMDYIFHNGFEAWKDMIQSIKDEYPKP